MKRRVLLFCAGVTVALFGVIGCRNLGPPAPALESVFSKAKLDELNRTVSEAIEAQKLPGAVVWLERQGVAYRKAFGRRAVRPSEEPMTEETIFDAASLTKVLATAPAVMLLVERGKIALDGPVQKYIAEFKGAQKGMVTVRHLLTHTSGLRAGISLTPAWSGYERAIELACAERLVYAPGKVFVYSDINYILLGELVRRVSGASLDEFAAANFYRPLAMADTSFLPPEKWRDRIAPTQDRPGMGILRGQVHDPTALRMGGVAGHAGLFTTASDVARFARMLLHGGELDGRRVFKSETVRQMITVQSPAEVHARRGLGWDIDSDYSGPRGQHFPRGSFGHTGFTGTSLWIDPFSKTFVIMMSNSVHPDGKGNVVALRSRVGSLAAEAVVGFNFAGVEGALPARPNPTERGAGRVSETRPVLNGIDVLVKNDFAPLKGLRVGLVTNQTGADRQRRSTIDLLFRAPTVQLVSLFSPEHGIRGLLDERVNDSKDERTGLPVYSLYGERRGPSSEQLAGLDALVFDIQDIGCRFYTYISTLGLCMEAAARAKLKFFVLDRVNPINGATIDGPVLSGETSFTGFHSIPVRHGMTVGELARMFNVERGFNSDLAVIPLENWSRELWFDQTQLPWINPSPNMRSIAEATLYPGVGLLETAAVSVGRGTGTPFEVVGAPYIDDGQWAAELNRLQLRGVRFVPVRFTPEASVYKGQICGGVNIVITDREVCRVVDIGLSMAQTLHRLYPKEFDLDKFDRLLVHRATIDAIKAGRGLSEIRELWERDLAEFKQRRARHLLY